MPAHIRYSRRPIHTYQCTVGRVTFGPATSPFLNTPEAWNLAYLSFDFDVELQHPDPHYNCHVRETCRAKLDGTPTGAVETVRARQMLAHLLLLPAPRFVYLIKDHPVLPVLPLYRAYGQQWLETIERRSWHCQTDRVHDAPIKDLAQAREVLARFTTHE